MKREYIPRQGTMTIGPYSFPMTVEYEFEEGEPQQWNGLSGVGSPGFPAYAVLLSCKVGGVDIYEMLDSEQIDRIEDVILEKLEV